jgi:hypothetical protein
MSKEPTKEPVTKEPPKQLETDPAAAPFDEDNIDYNRGRYHGLTEEQIRKVEDARYDDADGVPPPVQLPPEEPEDTDARAKAEAKAKKEREAEAEADKKRGAKHG